MTKSQVKKFLAKVYAQWLRDKVEDGAFDAVAFGHTLVLNRKTGAIFTIPPQEESKEKEV